MIINELSDFNAMGIQLVKSPPFMQWTYIDWALGQQVFSTPEQSVVDFLLQEETSAAPLSAITSKIDPDFLIEMAKGQVHNDYVCMLTGSVEFTRYPDEQLGLREISYTGIRGEGRHETGGPTSIILDGITSATALEPSSHSCLTINNMDEYEYDGRYHRLNAADSLGVIASDDKTWVFVVDGMIAVDDTPYFEGSYLGLTADETIEVLEDDSIILVLHRNGLHK
jgi:hypothetical protein